jgi:hypothetical protein
MRRLACFFLLAIISCNSSTSVTNMNGAYTMVKQNFKGNSVDTTSAENKQLKIYIDSVMMYVLVNHAQDVSAFAIGKFSIDSGKLIEHITYNATENLQSTDIFSDTVTITKNDTGYVQTTSKTASDKGKIKITETYKSAGTNTLSLLDGIWKQVSSYALRGRDTIQHNDIEYKAFYAGNFSYGDYYTDSMQKRTGISYGTFSIDSSHQLTETITASTWPELSGKTFVLDITINGKDSFTQTAINATGDKEISLYEKVKL